MNHVPEETVRHSAAAVVLRTPGKHLIATLAQYSQSIRFLWQVQRLEERLRSYLCVFQIRCVVLNPVQNGVGVVRSPDSKELDDKHRKNPALLNEPMCFPGGLSLG